MLITVHPITEDLKFLKKLVRKIRDDLDDLIIPFTLSNNIKSHERFLDYLKTSPEGALVIFLCHGISNSIYGCTYRYDLSSHPQRYVHEEHKPFINIGNISLLSNKKVISLSCNSAKLARYAVQNGTKVFIGFNEINFDRKELSSERVKATTKWLLRRALYWAIITSYQEDLTFREFNDKLTFSLRHLATKLLLEKKNKYTIRTAYCLNEIRSGIQILGNAEERLFS